MRFTLLLALVPAVISCNETTIYRDGGPGEAVDLAGNASLVSCEEPGIQACYEMTVKPTGIPTLSQATSLCSNLGANPLGDTGCSQANAVGHCDVAASSTSNKIPFTIWWFSPRWTPSTAFNECAGLNGGWHAS